MKVLMIAPQPFFSPRGTPFSVLYRLYALSRLGHEVDLVTYPLGEDVAIKNVSIVRTPRIPFVRRIDIGPSKTKVVLDFFVLLKTIQLLLKNRYDVIHSHEEAGFFSTGLSKIFKVKHLYDMHSSLPQQLENFKFTTSRFLIRAFERLERKTLKEADAVITICPALLDHVKKLIPGKNQVLIENVVDNTWVLDPASETAADLVKKFGIDGKIKILYTGTFESYQGIGLLVESAGLVLQEHPEAIFILVGGSPEQIESYRKQTEGLGLRDHFVFTGQVWPNLIPLFVELSDMLVSPRIHGTNTPLKIYSYLRSGRPIVATRHPTHTQVLDEDIAVLTEATPQAFAEGIIRLLRDDSLRIKIVKNAVGVAETKYSLESYLQKTEKIYATLENRSGT